MTAKQQSQVIIGKFIEGLHKNGNLNNVHEHATQCAIICVEQIIEALQKSDERLYEADGVNLHEDIYWQEVLSHLKADTNK